MSNNFITNSKNATLKRRLETLISASQELKFLVGFFYFSGWQELYKTLKKNNDVKLKILVGLEVDRHLGKLVEMDLQNANSFEEQTEYFMQSLTKAVNHKDMDNQDFHNQVNFFIELLETNRLLIRKTFEPNHSKLYLFQLNEPTQELFGSKGSFITGSSNLTKAGLHNQHEFNVEIKDYGYKNAEAYFDNLWKTAVPITENDIGKNRVLDILKNKSIVTDITPFEAYVFILKTYLDLQKAKDLSESTVRLLEENGFEKYSYQLDAVGQALSIIDEYNGLIIADVVGLGKSVIASLIASQLNTRGLILCPPGLVGDRQESTGWHEYKEKFGLHSWDIESVGMVETIAENIKNKNYEAIIVDEAHRFRNEDTTSYESLLEICRGKKVILLSATPFNNSPTDVFSLLKLFIIPGASSISLGGDLYGKFRAYNYRVKRLNDILKNHNSKYKDDRKKAKRIYLEMFDDLGQEIDIERVKQDMKRIAEEIKNTISPVVIRRNRIDLLEDTVYNNEIESLSKINDPEEQFFELSEEQSAFYDEIISIYFARKNGRFKGAIYQPFTYEIDDIERVLKMEENRAVMQQTNLYDFMRRLLVKRFESSFGAFEKSIERFLRVHKIVLSFIETSGKYILDRKLIEDIYIDDEGDDNFIEEDIIKMLEEFKENTENKTSPKHTTIYNVNKFKRKEEFLKDIENDLKMFEEIKEKIKELDLLANDPKRKSIVNKIKEVLKAENNPKRKVVLFTEYTDTVRHLEKYFNKEFKGRVAFCSGGISKTFAKELTENFDAKSEVQKDDYDVLVTSDKLSEGFNFNRAGLIINYDIPWNPTRVIQRVGRINRMSAKVFDELWIYNFFPTQRGQSLVRSREIAQQKMFLIHNALGEDAKIFNADETPTASGLYKKISSNPDDNEEVSESTFIRNEYKEISEKYPEVIKRITEFPNRVKTAKLFDEENVVVLRKKGLALFVVTYNYKDEKPEIKEQNLSSLLRLTKCEFDTPKQKLSEEFWDSYEMIQNYNPQYKGGKVGQSLINEAVSSLKSLQKNKEIELNEDMRQFIVTLINDIRNYKTLSDQTLRRLKLQGGKNEHENLKENIKQLQRRLGSDYLDIMLQRNANLEDDIIISVNNIKEKSKIETTK